MTKPLYGITRGRRVGTNFLAGSKEHHRVNVFVKGQSSNFVTNVSIGQELIFKGGLIEIEGIFKPIFLFIFILGESVWVVFETFGDLQKGQATADDLNIINYVSPLKQPKIEQASEESNNVDQKWD